MALDPRAQRKSASALKHRDSLAVFLTPNYRTQGRGMGHAQAAFHWRRGSGGRRHGDATERRKKNETPVKAHDSPQLLIRRSLEQRPRCLRVFLADGEVGRPSPRASKCV